MTDEMTVVYDFVTELNRDHAVSDKTFKAVTEKFGERGAIDLIGVCGYYTLISMVLNVAQVPLPPGAPPGLEPLKR
jgi:4-carboxymuconolactone decarboxylase